MPQYDEETIDQVVENVDLLEYVRDSIQMTKKGSDYFGRCPLHTDKTPSFSITPEKNRFFCFGCGRGGTIIQYLTEYEHLPYEQAVQKAANLAKLDLKMMCQSQTVKYNRELKRIRGKAVLQESHEILDKTIYQEFQKEPVSEWISEGIDPNVMDLFEVRVDERANRIVYPVYDTAGNFINVKGRTRFKNYKELGIAKYINYYPVGTLDYFQGSNVTEKHIAATKELIIFEGVKSVMKLYGYGQKNSVSAEKHDLTREQISWILRSPAKDVVLCYDTDVSYDEKSVKKNIQMLRRYVNLYVVRDPKGRLGGAKAKKAPVDSGKLSGRSYMRIGGEFFERSF